MMKRGDRAAGKQAFRRVFHAMLAVIMVLALLPQANVMAAGAMIKIENLFVSPTRPADTDDRVDRFSINGITVEATIEGISVDQIPNLYYEITNVNTGITNTNKGNPPAVSNNGYTVTFSNVQLTEGLNRIVIKLDGANVITSQPAWAYFTPATRIESLKINGDDFVEGRIYPELMNGNIWSSLIELSGYAYNTSEVTLQLYGDPSTYPAIVYGNRFSFIADREDGAANANFRLKPGDNLITITANNPSHSFQVQKILTYDNRDAFAFGAKLSDRELVMIPTIEHDTSVTNLYLDTKVKVDITDPTSGALAYNQVTVNVGGFTQTYDLTTMTPDANLSKTDRYNVYVIEDIEIDVNLLPTNTTYHQVSFVFTNTLNPRTTSYPYLGFYYVDPNKPYIEYVARKTGVADQVGTRMSQTAITEISEQPVTFFVYGDSKLQGVNVYLGDYKPGDTPVATATRDANNKIAFQLEGLNSGQQILTIIPFDASNAENEAGKHEYRIQVNTAPYVIFSNVYDGMVIDSLDKLQLTATDCIGGQPCIAILGRLVNVPQSELGNIKVFLNSVDITSSLKTDAATRRINVLISPDDTQPNYLKEGRNSLTIELYLNNVRAATSKLELFKFTQAAPAIVSFEIDQNSTNPSFTEGSVPGTYFTTEKTVTLYGTIANVDTISLRVQRTDDDGKQVVLYELYKDPADNGNFQRQTGTPAEPISNAVLFDYNQLRRDGFRTVPIELTGRGDTVIELFVTNDETNITVTRMITITRNANPYSIVYPQTYMVQGIPNANINSNYSIIEIEAEYADRIEFGKGEYAVYDSVREVFRYEVQNLKPGTNKINFTVYAGADKISGTLVLNYLNQPIVGAQYKTKLSNRIRVFDNKLELNFPRGTSLMRKGGDGYPNQYLTNDRMILFGIADELNGQIDPIRDPAMGSVLPIFTNRDPRFQTASELYWIDAGIIRWNTDLEEAYRGSGQLPHTGLYYLIRQQADLVVPTQRAELTIKYDESIVDEAWRYLTVFQFNILEDKNGVPAGRWVNLGGVVDTKKKTITVPIDSFGYFQVMYMDQSFDDIIVHNWARNELDTMFAKGYMEPKSPPSLFMPNDPITRGEFLTLLMKLYSDVYPLNYKGEPTFSDVFWNNSASTAYLYDYRYIETAARAGIVRGTGGGRFNPGDAISREDAAAMIARAANLKLESNETKVLNSLQKSFTDGAAIKYYHRSSVEAVVKAGLMTGKPHSVVGNEKQTYYFDPLAPITRAEAAAIAIRILQNEKKIPK
jgi:hypothetical protein